MNEEIVNLSGVIEYKELGERVEIIIRSQSRYGFDYRCREGGRTYKLGSCNCVEYEHSSWCGECILFLKGKRDSSRRDVHISIYSEDWAVLKKMLISAGFEVFDGNAEKPPKIVEEKTEQFSFKCNVKRPTKANIEAMISLVDLDVFTSIIKARLRSEGADGEDIKKINKDWAKEYLKPWAISKYRFYKLLGDKLKVEKDIEVEEDSEFYKNAKNELAEKFPLYAPLFENMSPRIIKENMLSRDEIWNNVFNDKRVISGMSFTKFISLYGSDELNIEVSKIYQNSGKAHVTLSIDPNDYLTVSINHSGWRSCHNFINGEWRNAGLSYMVDDTSMVAYRSNGDVNYKVENVNFKWNSKNWRQMIYVSKANSAIIFSRQYPNESEDLSRKIRGLFEEIVSEYYGVPNSRKVYNSADSAEIEVPNEDLLYNDVENNFNHKVVKNKFDKDIDKNVTIHLGGIPKAITRPEEDIEDKSEEL